MKLPIFILPLIILISSCATSGLQIPPTSRSQTIAKGVLYRDVTGLISRLESAWGSNCATPVVTKVIAVNPPNLSGKKPEAMEHWHIDRCGKEIIYAVMYHSDPRGGTHIGLSKIKG